jgi:hypothetical protein
MLPQLAQAQSDADAKLDTDAAAAAAAAAPKPAGGPAGAALDKLLKGIHADGPLTLSDGVKADLIALLPSARRGEECPTPAAGASEASGIASRGDGAMLVAQVTSCQGSFLMIYSPGVRIRASRLLDLEEGQTLADAHLLNLRGAKREDDLAITLHVGLTREETRLFLRRGDGFAFGASGTLPSFGEKGDCAGGGDVTGGFASFLKVDAKGRLEVLRVDTECVGGTPWQARCDLWTIDAGATTQAGVTQAGVCALPAKLDAKSLRSSGWR